MAKIDVKSFLDKKYEKLSEATGKLVEKPHLATILVGSRKDSQVYVRNKEKSIERAGMTSETIRISDGTDLAAIALKIIELNQDENINGILLQLPLNREYYSKEDEDYLIRLIHKEKDVDGLTPENQANLFMGKDQSTFLTPCTPTGIVQLLKDELYNNSLKGLDITVIGRSQLLGNSLAQMLMREDANVTTLHSESGWVMADYFLNNTADVICLCAGSTNLLTANDLSADNQYVIIDAAINVGENGKLRGDFKKEDYELLDKWSNYSNDDFNVDYTPVPGGVGPITTYTLSYNLYKAYCLQNKLQIENI